MITTTYYWHIEEKKQYVAVLQYAKESTHKRCAADIVIILLMPGYYMFWLKKPVLQA